MNYVHCCLSLPSLHHAKGDKGQDHSDPEVFFLWDEIIPASNPSGFGGYG